MAKQLFRQVSRRSDYEFLVYCESVRCPPSGRPTCHVNIGGLTGQLERSFLTVGATSTKFGTKLWSTPVTTLPTFRGETSINDLTVGVQIFSVMQHFRERHDLPTSQQPDSDNICTSSRVGPCKELCQVSAEYLQAFGCCRASAKTAANRTPPTIVMQQ